MHRAVFHLHASAPRRAAQPRRRCPSASTLTRSAAAADQQRARHTPLPSPRRCSVAVVDCLCTRRAASASPRRSARPPPPSWRARRRRARSAARRDGGPPQASQDDGRARPPGQAHRAARRRPSLDGRGGVRGVFDAHERRPRGLLLQPRFHLV